MRLETYNDRNVRRLRRLEDPVCQRSPEGINDTGVFAAAELELNLDMTIGRTVKVGCSVYTMETCTSQE